MPLTEIERPASIGFGSITFERPAILKNIHARGECFIGAYSYTNSNCNIYDTHIGRYCSIAHDVMIGPVEHPTNLLSTSGFAFGDRVFAFDKRFVSMSSPLIDDRRTTCIGNDVWIGSGAFIKRGVTVSDGSIIGALSVVTKDVPPYAIVVGNPAKLLRFRFGDETIAKALTTKWWNFDFSRDDLNDLPYSEIDSILDLISEQANEGRLKSFNPERLKIQKGPNGYDFLEL